MRKFISYDLISYSSRRIEREKAGKRELVKIKN